MRKVLSLLVVLAVLFLLSSCNFLSGTSRETNGNSNKSKPANTLAEPDKTIEPEKLIDTGDEKITDTVAKELFEKAVKEIITLASEEPVGIIKAILGDDIEVFYEEKKIEGLVYYETTAKYEELQNYYSKIFCGDALSWILSTKFADVDGTLYCSPIGGATGWNIANTEVVNIDKGNGIYKYQAKFNKVEYMKDPETANTNHFTIIETENGYRISSIDYIPDMLTILPPEKIEIEVTKEQILKFYDYFTNIAPGFVQIPLPMC